MAYDSNNEFINIAGEKAYNCEFDIVTPTTRSSLDLNLLMNHDMEDDEMMRGVIDIEQEYQTISLGIMPQYDFIRQSRITIGAGLALNANYITSFNQTMDIKLFHNSYIMTRKSMNDNQGNGLNRFYVSASINSYIEYQWNQRFSTGVNASLGRSLNSLSQYTITHMKDINIGITSQYRF